MNNKKVLFAIHTYDRFAGGIDNAFSRLENNLPDYIKHDILVFKNIVNLPHKAEKIYFLSTVKLPSFILRHKKRLKFLVVFIGFYILLYRIIKFYNFLKKNGENYKKIVVFDDYFSVIVLMSTYLYNKKYKKNIKVIPSVRNSPRNIYSYGNLIHLLPDFFYLKIAFPIIIKKLSYLVHGVAEGLKTELKEKFNINNVVIIHNLYDFSKIEELANEDIEFKFDYLLNVGHINFAKNQKDLIKAFFVLKKEYKIKEKLLIIGKGPLKEELISLVNSLNLKNEVIFLEPLSNPYKYMKRANVFVLTSLYEGFPNVLVEAGYLKTPIVSYKIEHGVSEIVKNPVEKGDIKSLSFEIYRILTDKNYREECIFYTSNRIENIFNKERIIKKWEELLK